MAKKMLQSVGEDTVAFDDVCYWVAENVKRYLPNFTPGMEVDVTVKNIDGVDMVTFLKKAGAPAQAPAGQRPAYPPQQGYGQPAAPAYAPPQQQYQAPRAPPMQMPNQPAQTVGGLTGNLDLLTAAIILAYQIDPVAVMELAKQLKSL